MIYEWRNKKTGEVVDHDSATEPPKRRGTWVRVYSFGVGRVEGAGSSRSRPSTKMKGSNRGNN